MNTTRTWLGSEPCTACGTSLHLTDNGTPAITWECPACGWTLIGDLATQDGGRR